VSPAPSTSSDIAAAQAAGAIAARLADPAVVNALGSILDHVDLLAILIEGLDQMISRSDVIGDSIVESLAEVREAGGSAASPVDVGAVVQSGIQLAGVLPKATPGMVAAVESGAIDKILASGVVSGDALEQVAMLARGLVQGTEEFNSKGGIEVTGLLSASKLLKDPDIRRTLSFFATVAKAIGQQIQAGPVPVDPTTFTNSPGTTAH
jgi:uncharacterized protein YoaH (UPF0181 family)